MPGVKISNLQDGAALQNTDSFPVARGGATRRIEGSRLLTPETFQIQSTPTIGLNWNSNTKTLQASATSAVTSFNTVNSPTINLNWNSSTRTLSADASYLLTLINQLSSNMQTIGNYPYLEYAWVTALNAAGQSLTANLSSNLNLTQEIYDTGNFGSLNNNQITLAAGTYEFDTDIHVNMREASVVQCALYDVTNNRYLSRAIGISPSTSMAFTSNWFSGDKDNWTVKPNLKGRFVLTSSATISIIALPSVNALVGYPASNGGSGFVFEFTSSQQVNQRTTIKLWKVG